MNDLILRQLTDKFYEFGKKMGFSAPIIRSNKYTSEIYLTKNHALQLEVDWRENNLFMYIVYLKNNKLPDTKVVYSYEDGQWCRKLLEEVYKTKRPHINDRISRYSPEYLFDCFEFYAKLVSSNPAVLHECQEDGSPDNLHLDKE